MEDERKPMDLSKRYPKAEKENADSHAWVFPTKDKFELYYCNYPSIADNEVRGNILYTGLCHSDVLSARDLWGKRSRPCCPGHEIIAEITQVGKNVTTRKVGDIIGVGPFRDFCDNCEQCEQGNTQICTGLDIAIRDTYVHKFGGYSTTIVVRADATISIPNGMDLSITAPLLCAGITVYRPLRDHVSKGQKVGILGIGGLGHLAVQYAAKLGYEVTGFTRTESKVDFIKQLGASNVIVVDKELTALSKIGRSLDAILNTLPVSDLKSYNAYLSTIKPNGKMIQVGAPPVDIPLKCGFFSIIASQIQIIGSMVGSIKDTQEMINFSHKNGVKCMCEHYTFDDFPKAFDKLENGRPHFRCVVNCQDYSKAQGL